MENVAPRPFRRIFRLRSPEVVAGVDLGSNSFHLLVARLEEDGRVHVLDKLKDPVRLAAGLDQWQRLTPEANDRALAALERFGERLRDMPSSAVRAVGTNTLRRVRDGAEVEERFARALGHPIEIISGREEARLIYLGVASVTPEAPGARQLVLDIGGGSTECIIGEGFEPLVLDSLYMGCVSYTSRFFGKGRISRERFRRAEVAAGLELSSIRERYREVGWERAVGSSGTILAIREVLRLNGWGEELITRPALKKLEAALISCKRIGDLSLPGLEPDRAPVFPGGVAILGAAFQQLEIESLDTSSGALREGLVHELLGRVQDGDPRDRTVDTFASRYKVDRSQAKRVEATASLLFEQANEAWGYDADVALRYLGWASRVHEIGLSISFAGHHKHGAYILEHAEMPGFSLDDQAMLAAIVGGHRRKPSRETFAQLDAARRKLALHSSVVLRIAASLHRSRSEEALPEMRLEVERSRMRLVFPVGWLDERPLTRIDLEEQASNLGRIGIDLELESQRSQGDD